MKKTHGTTIISVRRNGKLAMGGDGQGTFGNTIMKAKARKIRKVVVQYPQGWLATALEKTGQMQASWRTDPICPVAQKTHPQAQPIWLDMQALHLWP